MTGNTPPDQQWTLTNLMKERGRIPSIGMPGGGLINRLPEPDIDTVPQMPGVTPTPAPQMPGVTAAPQMDVETLLRAAFAAGNRMIIMTKDGRGLYQTSMKRPDGNTFSVEVHADPITSLRRALDPLIL